MKLMQNFILVMFCLSCGQENKNSSQDREKNKNHVENEDDIAEFLLEAGHSIDLIAIENDDGHITNLIKITRKDSKHFALQSDDDVQNIKSESFDSKAEEKQNEPIDAHLEKNTIYFENYVIQVPENFEPTYHKDGSPVVLGKKGSHGIVFQVNKVLEDGSVEPWAMKYLYRHNEMMAKVSQWFQGQSEIEEEKNLVRQWKKFGNPIEIETFEGRNDIVMKTIVQGRTLKELIEQGTFFSSFYGKTQNHSEDLQETLKQLILDISSSKQIFDDLNPANIMYDYTKKQWVVIDSKLAVLVETEKEALSENTKKFNDKIIYSNTIDEHNRIHAQKKMLGTGKNTPDYTLKTFVKMVEFAESISNLNEPHIMENLLMEKTDSRRHDLYPENRKRSLDTDQYQKNPHMTQKSKTKS